MEHEMGLKGLNPVHRLDRQTSGIVFFARDDKAANEFRQALNDDQVGKVYLARVLGDFAKKCDDEGKVTVKKWLYVVSKKYMLYDC